MIPVTKPFLPPVEEYKKFIDIIYNNHWLTNNGPLVQELELKLKSYLGVENLLFLGNGTIALQMAIKALDLKGEIITTPFSYVATTSSIVWEGCKPVFADIDPHTLNIDPNEIINQITPNTSAILATHVFGNPCDIESIQKIANEFNLKVIFDAAHCFGSQYNGQSVYKFGDIVTTSFHATKLFHTSEGGAVFTNNDNLLRRLSYIRNFGHDGPEKFNGVGINGKNSEFHAAMGLVNLNYIDLILDKRRMQCIQYISLLENIVQFIEITFNAKFNYAYMPVIFESEKQTLKVIEALNKNDIFPRRYFYPSLSKLDYLSTPNATPISDSISSRIICLPLFHELELDEIKFISKIIVDNV